MKLCDHHKENPKWFQCTPGFIGCEVAILRAGANAKRRGRPRSVAIPEDIEALSVSKQYKLQLAWQRMGLCRSCGREPIDEASANYCTYHHKLRREAQRRKHGSMRRNLGCVSYTTEQQPSSLEVDSKGADNQ